MPTAAARSRRYRACSGNRGSHSRTDAPCVRGASERWVAWSENVIDWLLSQVLNILVVNPGSTTTKVALFEDETESASEVFRHDDAALASCATLWDQFERRWQAIDDWTSRNAREVSAVAAIGGLLRPLAG